MKMTSPASLSIALLASAAMLVASCTKSITNNHEDAPASTEKTASDATLESIASPYSLDSVIGTYGLRGSRTQYRGQANNQGTNITVIFDYGGTREIKVSGMDKALTCGYCSDGFIDKGWMYLIRVDKKTKQITLSPNDKMLANIKPNSFETLYASYDPVYHSFAFQTRYTAMDGNENEVVDLLNKQ